MKPSKQPRTLRKIGMVLIGAALFAYCGDPIPVEKMGEAKQAISKASRVKAQDLAKNNYDMAVKELLAAHDQISEGEMDEARKKAEEAKRLANLAYNEAAPKIAAQTRQSAEEAMTKADEAYAEEFAAEDYQNAKVSFEKGKEAEANNRYEDAYKNYTTSLESAEKARNLSEAQAETMQRDIDEIDDTISEARKYGAETSAPSALSNAETSSRSAKTKVAQLKLKSASEDIAVARQNAQQALKVAQKDWATKGYMVAEEDVSNAEKELAELNEALKDDNVRKYFMMSDDAKDTMQSTEDTMAASKESLRTSESALNSGAYQDSKSQSEEASRLARIVKDQIPQVKVLVAKAREDALKREGKDNDTDTKVAEGWKKYTVILNVKRRDCLWRIAERDSIYGNARLWPRIYKANKDQIKNPDLIYPGQVFDIPPKSGSIVKPTDEGNTSDSDSTTTDDNDPASDDTVNDDNNATIKDDDNSSGMTTDDDSSYTDTDADDDDNSPASDDTFTID